MKRPILIFLTFIILTMTSISQVNARPCTEYLRLREHFGPYWATHVINQGWTNNPISHAIPIAIPAPAPVQVPEMIPQPMPTPQPIPEPEPEPDPEPKPIRNEPQFRTDIDNQLYSLISQSNFRGNSFTRSNNLRELLIEDTILAYNEEYDAFSNSPLRNIPQDYFTRLNYEQANGTLSLTDYELLFSVGQNSSYFFAVVTFAYPAHTSNLFVTVLTIETETYNSLFR